MRFCVLLIVLCGALISGCADPAVVTPAGDTIEGWGPVTYLPDPPAEPVATALPCTCSPLCKCVAGECNCATCPSKKPAEPEQPAAPDTSPDISGPQENEPYRSGNGWKLNRDGRVYSWTGVYWRSCDGNGCMTLWPQVRRKR